jgi:Chorismate synthase
MEAYMTELKKTGDSVGAKVTVVAVTYRRLGGACL